MRTIISIGAVVCLLTTSQIALGQGTTIFLSNVGLSSASNVLVGSDSWIAAGFQTGTNTAGYSLDSIQLDMASSTGSPNDFTVMVYANRSPAGTFPGSSLATFMGSMDPATSGTYTFTASEGLTLSPESVYFIVISADTPIATGAYQWSYASSTGYSLSDGWSLVAIESSINGGSTWSIGPHDPMQFALIGSVAPEPGVLGLLAVGGVGMFLWTKKVRGTRLGARGE